MKQVIFFLSACVALCASSCKKTDLVTNPVPQASRLVTAPGTPEGTATSKLINAAAGGTISSADGRISISIPAGALAANETITIQPLTNNTGFGIGKTYRLTPHEINFSKPVSISFKYTAGEVAATNPDFLTIGFRDQAGAWQAMNRTSVNKQAKSLTVTTTHFSEWGFFPLIYIEPGDARVALNKSVPLRVMYAVDPEQLDYVPSPDNTPMNEPHVLQKSYIKRWIFAGKGTLTSNGAEAVYTAPAAAPSQNPEAVNAEINFRDKGLFLLVANITVLSDFHIDYLQVDETEVNLPQLNRRSRLLIYGNFGGDPGANNSSVKVGSTNLVVSSWSPKLIVCEIPPEGPGSSGDVVVRSGTTSSSKLLNEWTVNFHYAKKESHNGQLTRKVRFVLRFRGDAIGFGSGDTPPLLPYTDLNKSSLALINMPQGTDNTNVTLDACGTFSVNWSSIANYETRRSLYSGGDGFCGQVYQSATGFGVKIKFLSAPVLKTTRSFMPCTGEGYTQVVNEPISFEGYHEETLWFPFATEHSRTKINGGSLPQQTGTGSAPGLFWDAPDVQLSQFTIKASWDEALPKFQ